jgi:membrane protein implicated in regulation of membrane protease activity
MFGPILTWIFIGVGILLMIIEAAVPAGVLGFFGISGVIVGILRYFGIIAGVGVSVIIWLGISIAMIIALRPLLKKYWGGTSFFKLADEDYEAMDQIVDVIEPVGFLDNNGRIRFRGSSWSARSEEGTIPQGSKAKIKYRDNLTWVIEPLEEPDET